MTPSEISAAQSAVLGDVYSRAFASRASAGPVVAGGVARRAVRDYIAMMQEIDNAHWGWMSLPSPVSAPDQGPWT